MQKLAEAIGTCNVLLRLGVVGISAEQRFWILTEAAKAIGATGHSEAALKRNTEGERSFESCRRWWKLIIHSNDKTASNLEPFQVWNNLLKTAAENIKQFLTSSVHSEETVLGYLERAEYYLQENAGGAEGSRDQFCQCRLVVYSDWLGYSMQAAEGRSSPCSAVLHLSSTVSK